MAELIYDLRTQPWSLGDVLHAQAAKLCECESYDVVFLHDENVRPENFKHIPPNYGRFIDWPMGAARAIKSADSVEVRPVTSEPVEDYQFYRFMAKVMASPRFPTLETGDGVRQWAERFHAEHGTIGTVHIRKHPNIPHQRDANVEAWREFLESVKERLVILGDVPIDGPHICSTHTTEQQLALIETARFHMGSSSGPTAMAMHGTHPYRVFNTNAFSCIPQYFKNGAFVRGPSNRWFEGKESSAFLSRQYAELIEEAGL